MASRMQFKKLQDQKLALYACQRALRGMLIAKTWKWMQIWLAIKPNLKCTQFSKYKKEYEDQIALAEANIGEAMRQCDAVVSKHEALVAEKNELQGVLASGGSAVQDIINKTERLEAAKAEDELIHGIEQSGVKVTADANRLRDTIKTLEANCEKCEEDKSTKDNQIHTLREE